MKNLTDTPDIELLVNSYYDKVKQDPLLAPVFADVYWPAHLPVMYRFWATMLLGNQSYAGNPFQKHVGLKIEGRHFERWLALFTETVDMHFEGPMAEEVKSRAQSIAGVWRFKLGLDQ